MRKDSAFCRKRVQAPDTARTAGAPAASGMPAWAWALIGLLLGLVSDRGRGAARTPQPRAAEADGSVAVPRIAACRWSSASSRPAGCCSVRCSRPIRSPATFTSPTSRRSRQPAAPEMVPRQVGWHSRDVAGHDGRRRATLRAGRAARRQRQPAALRCRRAAGQRARPGTGARYRPAGDVGRVRVAAADSQSGRRARRHDPPAVYVPGPMPANVADAGAARSARSR